MRIGVVSMKEYKICMYLDFWAGDEPDTNYPGEDKLWLEILLDEYWDGVLAQTLDYDGFELPLSFMSLGADEREAMRSKLMGRAAENIADMLERHHIDDYDFDPCCMPVDLMQINHIH